MQQAPTRKGHQGLPLFLPRGASPYQGCESARPGAAAKGWTMSASAVDEGLTGEARDWAVETHNLTKRFGASIAVDGVDLKVPRGCAFRYLGPNGAGKTTLIRVLLVAEQRHRPGVGARQSEEGGFTTCPPRRETAWS
jgi:ATPase subunit of ABC transporter with duplicated ATPase domains